MNIHDFTFDLPKELIAQTPLKDREQSRLMVLDIEANDISHHRFTEIIDYLNPNDVLVRNNTRVIPARIIGTKEDTGAVIELLLFKQDESDVWECMVRNAKAVKLDTVVSFGNGLLKAKCVEVKEEGIRVFKMIYEGIFLEILDQLGEVPLPPYIKEKLDDKERYQTVYSKVVGAAAAPTAGLHFTSEILKQIEDKGIKIVDVTLHVGLGTFKPIVVENIEEHKMHSEYYEMSEETASILNSTRASGGRIVVVGTTSLRTLETIYQKYDRFNKDSGWTDIFIYPGYTIKSIDALITNFHLPDSTLILLVSSFAGVELIKNAYQEAINEKYRFFSFGDAMLIKGRL